MKYIEKDNVVLLIWKKFCCFEDYRHPTMYAVNLLHRHKFRISLHKKHLNELIKNEDKVLEVGCATWHYGIYYADKCCEYLGIDIVQIISICSNN